MRWLGPTLVVLLLAACGANPTRRPPPDSTPNPTPTGGAGQATTAGGALNACAPTRVHRDSDYTPGGLYAPGVADGGPPTPIDVSGVLEPVPRAEARSRYGNRSPYTVLGKNYHVLDTADGYFERGIASWYGTKFNGRATSSGELYDMCVFSAAHKTLPLPSFVRVTNLDNGRSLIVRVNDRGPFHSGRIMDLSYAAAVRLGVDRTGTARVQLQSIASDARTATCRSGFSRDCPNEEITPKPPMPAPATPVDATPKLVQVGSFAEKANARRLADRLQDAGVDDVDVDRAEVAGRDVWRVRIGPVHIEKLARLLEHLRLLDLPSPRVFSE